MTNRKSGDILLYMETCVRTFPYLHNIIIHVSLCINIHVQQKVFDGRRSQNFTINIYIGYTATFKL